MVLQQHPSFPAARSYVLKLHRDAAPEAGKLAGRLEAVMSGEQYEFSNGEELLACLARALHSLNGRMYDEHGT
jgi:hypothetical protein